MNTIKDYLKALGLPEDTVVEQVTALDSKWEKETDFPSYEEMDKNIGIGNFNAVYLETNASQNAKVEMAKINNFLQSFIQTYAKNNNLRKDEIKIEFINYGKTELVYVLTEKSGKRVTLLVKQPAVHYGKVKQEADNLINLKRKDKMIVAPIDYFANGEYELYVTPYINQARCIASDFRWGMYVPEPYYRFDAFTDEQEKIVNRCMIAKLVSYYDFDKNCGIGSCKLGGGDFMLPKGWERQKPTIENTLSQLRFIAAREMIDCSFEEYLSLIRTEFAKATINLDQSKLKINLRGRVPMKAEDIDAGIELYKQGNADMVVAVSPSNRHPAYDMVRMDESNNINLILNNDDPLARQRGWSAYDLTNMYFICDADFAAEEPNFFRRRTKALEVPREKSFDICNQIDLKLAEIILAGAAK